MRSRGRYGMLGVRVSRGRFIVTLFSPARPRRVAVAVCGLALVLAAAPDRSLASEPVAWVVAGYDFPGLRLPAPCSAGSCAPDPSRPLVWPATSVALGPTTVVALGDGTLLVRFFDPVGWLRLGLDGHLRRWPVRFESGEPVKVDWIDTAPDGSVVATSPEPGPGVASAVVRVTPDGLATRIGRIRGRSGHIAALPDGGALVSGGGTRVWRIRADGAVSVAAARLDGAGALAAMPDGGFLVNDANNRRVRRVAANGVITTVFGDGRFRFGTEGTGQREGASAIKVDGSDVRSLHAHPAGGFYVTQVSSGGRGRLLRVDAQGKLTSVRLGAGADGRVAHPEAVDVQADGSLVLVSGNSGGGYQVRVMAPLERMQRFVVSFTARVEARSPDRGRSGGNALRSGARRPLPRAAPPVGDGGRSACRRQPRTAQGRPQRRGPRAPGPRDERRRRDRGAPAALHSGPEPVPEGDAPRAGRPRPPDQRHRLLRRANRMSPEERPPLRLPHDRDARRQADGAGNELGPARSGGTARTARAGPAQWQYVSAGARASAVSAAVTRPR